MVAQEYDKPVLILVLGLPGAGKTNFATRLSADLSIPQIGKDEIKELLFDHLGSKDREWSKNLGGISFELLYWTLGKLLQTGSNIIADVDFSNLPLATSRLKRLQDQCPFHIFQINLVANGDVLFSRFKERSLSGNRHAGHVDHENLEEFKPTLLKGRRENLDLKGGLIEVDTTNFTSIRYGEIASEIKKFMEEQS